MLDRMKQSLVNNFVGAIGLGWLFANGIYSFANIFASPIADWIVRSEYHRMIGTTSVSGFLLRDAIPELLRSFVLLLIGYILLRWLYYIPQEECAHTEANSGPIA